MLAEIARKREELERARAEAARRELECAPGESLARSANDARPHTDPGGRPVSR
jgi:hypothetical protein